MEIKARILLIALALQFNFNWMKIFVAISTNKKPNKKYVRLANTVEKDYVTLLDENYPEGLKNITRPPFLFKVKGDLSKIHTEHILVNSYTRIVLKEHNSCIIKPFGGGYDIHFSDVDTVIHVHDLGTAIQVTTAFCKAVVMDSGVRTDFLRCVEFYYLENKKPIGCMPTIRTSKVNDLIKQGAYLYDNEMDIDTWK